MEATEVDEVMSELSKVKEDLCSTLQENEELRSQFEMLQARNKETERLLHRVRVLVDLFKLVVDSE